MNKHSGLRRPSYTDRNGKKKQSKIWWMDYFCKGCMDHPKGGRHQESTGKKLQRQAQGELDIKRGIAAEGKPIASVNEIRIAELFQGVRHHAKIRCKPSTQAEYEDKIKNHLEPFFLGYRAVDLCYDDSIIRSFIAKKKETLQEKGPNKGKPLSEATIDGMLSVLILAFSLASNKLEGRHPRIKKFNPENSRKGYFNDKEHQTLLSHFPDDVRRVAEVAYITGWRVPSELLSRQRRHVDWKAGKLILEPGESKNKEPRIFPFTKELREILEEQEAATKALERHKGMLIPWLFHHEGEPMVVKSNRGWKYQRYFLETWKAALQAAGLAGRIRHDFRRSATRNFDLLPDHIGMKLTGHKTARIYQAYKAIGEADLFEAVKKLDDANPRESNVKDTKQA